MVPVLSGSQLGFSQRIYDLIAIRSILGDQIENFPMPQNPYVWPYGPNSGTAYIATSTADAPPAATASTPTTAKATFDAQTLVTAFTLIETFVEDSVQFTSSTLEKKIVESLADATDNAMLNGDISATHMDTGETAAANDQRRAYSGFPEIVPDYKQTQF